MKVVVASFRSPHFIDAKELRRPVALKSRCGADSAYEAPAMSETGNGSRGSTTESVRSLSSAVRLPGPLMDRNSPGPKSSAEHYSQRPAKGFLPGGCGPVRQKPERGPPSGIDRRVSSGRFPDSRRLNTWMFQIVRALPDRDRAGQATVALSEVDTATRSADRVHGRLSDRSRARHRAAATMIMQRRERSPAG